MKKIVLFVVLLANMGWAQAKLDVFEGMDQVKSVVVNAKMFELMGKVKMDESDKEASRYLAIIKKLNQLKLFTTADKNTATQMKSTVAQYVASNQLAQWSKITDRGKIISLYANAGAEANPITEMVLFVEGASPEETVLFSLQGSIDVNDIAFLSDRLKLPAKEFLQKTLQSAKK